MNALTSWIFARRARERAKKARTGQPPASPPRHIAIILDGNGRWASRRGLPRTAGHAAGAETFRQIATYCRDIGVEYLTVYAFSTENWKRPRQEVEAIMDLLGKYLRESVETMERDHIRLKILGDPAVLSDELRALIDETAQISGRYEGFQANVCINYGGRDEIVRAARRYAEDYKAGLAGELTEEGFSPLYVLRRHPRPRPGDTPGRGDAPVQLPHVGERLFRALFHRRAVAGLHPGGYRRRRGRVPPA